MSMTASDAWLDSIFAFTLFAGEGSLSKTDGGPSVAVARTGLDASFRSFGRSSLGFGDFAGRGDPVGGPLERGDVDALHLHHRVDGPPCPGAIGIANQPDKLAGNDPPRHTEAVFHPAALLSLESASAKRSASAWVSTGIWNEIASLNWN